MRDHVRWRLGVAATVMVVAALAVLLTGSVAFAADPTEPFDNGECRQCHDSTTTYDGGVTEKWDYFDVNTAVPESPDPCAACHLSSFSGPSHPYHNLGFNCAGCHVGMLFPLSSAIPWYPDGASTFNNATSRDSSSSVIHQIHNEPSWPSAFTMGTGANSVCSDCHATVACAACHTDATASNLSAAHKNHAGFSGTTETVTWTYGPATGSIEEANKCSGTNCHNLPSIDTWRGALLYEDGKTVSNLWSSNPPEGYAVNSGNRYYDNLGSSTSAGARYWWGKRSGGNFSYGVEAYCNQTNYYVEIPFIGARAILIADKDEYRGIARIRIDALAPVDVDLYSASTKVQQAVFDSLGTYLDPSVQHTMRITVTGTKNGSAKGAWVTFDQLQVFGESDADYANRNGAKCTASGCHGPSYESVHTSGTVVSFSHEATQEVTPITYGSGNYACSQCHYLTFKVGIDPNTEHGRTTSNVAKDCSPCHGVAAWPGPTDGSIDPLWNGTCSANTCHNSGANEHAGYVSQHDTSGLTGEDVTCLSCHAGDLRAIHDNSVTTNALTPNCLTCHGTTKYETDKSCTACHGTMSSFHPQVDASHLANSSQGSVPNDGGLVCTTCHSLYVWHSSQVGEHEKSWSTGGTITCTTCHSAAYFPSPWTNALCTDCHATSKAPVPHNNYTVKHNYETYSGTNVTSCETGGYCHDVSLGDTVHLGSWPRNNVGACTNCHDATTQTTEQLCADCHAGSPYHTQSTAHDASGVGNDGCANGSCHTAYETLTGHTGGCASCHNNATLTASNTRVLAGTYTDACTSCHHDGAGGIGAPQPTPDHYPVASHTTTSTAMSTSVDNVGSATKNCLSCHVADLEAEHAVVLGEAYNNYSNSVDCIDCHGSTSPINAAAQVTANWTNDTCADCHSSAAWTEHSSVTNTSTAAGTRHEQSVDDTTTSDAACSSCHSRDGVGAAANMAYFHNERTAVATPSVGVTSCNLCHEDADTAPVATTCLGCHPDKKGDHGAATAHDFAATGDYSSTGLYGAGDPAGCTNSGAGCHGTESTYADFVPYHTALTESPGCQLTCHSSADKATFTSTFDGDADCTDCHNSNYANAPDRIQLYDAPNNGHYNDTTHTADGTYMASRFDSGTYTLGNRCQDCHDDSLKVVHTGTTNYNDVVCGECHNAYPLVVAGWQSTTAECSDCHGAVEVTDFHDGYNTVHTATDGTNNCASSGAGCHNSSDLRVLHAAIKGGASTAGCGVAQCHTTLDARPTITACGSGAGGCHTGYTDTTGHRTATVTGDDAAYHTANDDTLTYSTITKNCSDCHTRTMVAGHTGTPAATCTGCHNDTNPDSVTVIKTNSWSTKTCDECHVTNRGTFPTRHNTYASGHVGTSTQGCLSGGAGCHGTDSDLRTIHETLKGGATTSGCNISGCHDSLNKDMTSAPKSCENAACHSTYTSAGAGHIGVTPPGTDATYHTAGSMTSTLVYGTITEQCQNCHSAAMATAHTGTNAATCTGCHSDTAPNSVYVVKTTSWSTKTCDECHVTYENGFGTRHNTYASGHVGTSTQGCLSGGAGCHGTESDLRTIHETLKGGASTFGCRISGCHATNKDMSTAPKNCENAACHSTYTSAGAGHIGVTPPGTDATYHTAGGMTTKVDGTTYDTGGGNTCQSCHSAAIATAHTGTNAATCTGCHSDTTPNSVYVIKTDSWSTKLCQRCHGDYLNGYTAMHNTYTAGTHTATTGTNCSIGSCHGGVTDVRTIHNVAKANRGCTASGSDSFGSTPACHALNTPMTTGGMRCGNGGTSALNCHTSHTAVNHGGDHTAAVAGYEQTTAGCFGCHYTDLKREHGDQNVESLSLAGAYRTMQMYSGGNYVQNNASDDRCNACHDDKGGAVGKFNETYNTNVNDIVDKNARYTTYGKRCEGCHYSNGTAGPRIAHSGGSVPNTPAYSTNYTDQFKNWTEPTGGGHRVLSTQSPPYIFQASNATVQLWNVGTSGMETSPLTGTWNFYTTGFTAGLGLTTSSMIKCDGCHNSVGANGPQGASGVISADTTATQAWLTATVGTRASTVCAKCHGASVSGSHGSHNSTLCIGCHIRIPHGWKRLRLLRRTYSFTGYPGDAYPYVPSPADNGMTAFGITADNKGAADAWSFSAGSWGNGDCADAGCKNHNAVGSASGQLKWVWP